jgi:hypothetical protein
VPIDPLVSKKFPGKAVRAQTGLSLIASQETITGDKSGVISTAVEKPAVFYFSAHPDRAATGGASAGFHKTALKEV